MSDIEKFLQQNKLPEELDVWLQSDDFAKSWKSYWAEALTFTKAILEDYSPKMNVRAYRRGKALWVELREPIPGVRLITYEMQQQIYPLRVCLRAWIYGENKALSEKMLALGEKTFIGQSWRVQKITPTAQWEQYLLESETKVLGVGYTSHDLNFLADRDAISGKMRKLSDEFTDFILNVSVAK